jgi:hypothetical protein
MTGQLCEPAGDQRDVGVLQLGGVLASGSPAPLRQDRLDGPEEDRHGQRGLRLPDAELPADVRGEVSHGGLVPLPLFLAKGVIPAAGGAQGGQGGPAVCLRSQGTADECPELICDGHGLADGGGKFVVQDRCFAPVNRP